MDFSAGARRARHSLRDVASAAERQRALEEASVRHAIHNLATFPCVKILLDKGRIAIHGAWFDIGTGELWLLDGNDGNFRPALAGQR